MTDEPRPRAEEHEVTPDAPEAAAPPDARPDPPAGTGDAGETGDDEEHFEDL